MNELVKRNEQLARKPVDRIKAVLSAESVQDQLRQTLGENKEAFVASLLDLYGTDSYLQKCPPGTVVQEAFKAAALDLPIAKSLGFAYIVPFKNVPTFVLGYKGLIQLAQRTGRYKYINAGVVRQGETPISDKVSGAFSIEGEPDSPDAPALGYFAYFETLEGFCKTEYWSMEKILSHRKRFVKAKSGPWFDDNFDMMASKTVLKALIGRYGPLTTKVVRAFEYEARSPEAAIQEAMDSEEPEFIDVEAEEVIEDETEGDHRDGLFDD